jgi:hypothetical protein
MFIVLAVACLIVLYISIDRNNTFDCVLQSTWGAPSNDPNQTLCIAIREAGNARYTELVAKAGGSQAIDENGERELLRQVRYSCYQTTARFLNDKARTKFSECVYRYIEDLFGRSETGFVESDDYD